MQHRAHLTVIECLLGIVPHLTGNRQAARVAVAPKGESDQSVLLRGIHVSLIRTTPTGRTRRVTLSLACGSTSQPLAKVRALKCSFMDFPTIRGRSEEHTSELQSL